MQTKLLRLLLLSLGHMFLVLGIIGAFLPLLPTTPFILLASACYARSSEKFQKALLSNRLFGPMLKNWQETKSISTRAKSTAVLTIFTGITISIWLLDALWTQLLLIVVGITISGFIITRPTPPIQKAKQNPSPD